MILYVKLLKGNVHVHIRWNWNHVYTVCVVWIVVWISRAFQCVVNYFATNCKEKPILNFDSLNGIQMVQDTESPVKHHHHHHHHHHQQQQQQL